jgi:hypothetical protein
LRTAWEILTAGTADAAHGVLLLPGGAMAARSYNRVMAEPALEGTHLVAATLPGMAGAPIAGDMAITAPARHAADLAAEHRCDVVVGCPSAQRSRSKWYCRRVSAAHWCSWAPSAGWDTYSASTTADGSAGVTARFDRDAMHVDTVVAATG